MVLLILLSISGISLVPFPEKPSSISYEVPHHSFATLLKTKRKVTRLQESLGSIKRPQANGIAGSAADYWPTS
jgi:hypothetical protein